MYNYIILGTFCLRATQLVYAGIEYLHTSAKNQNNFFERPILF